VIDGQTYSRLQDVIRREGRSLLQYAIDSFPWAAGNSTAGIDRLKELAGAEADAVAALARLLARHHLAPPWLGAYPTPFTSFNFLSLDRLVPLLVRYQRDDIARLEGELAEFEDREVHGQVKHLLDVKRHNLKQLEELATLATPAAKT
jgi:hypothetical protein